MYTHQSEDLNWAVGRMNEHVSYSGWGLAMMSGLLLWAMLFRMVV